MHQKAIWMLIFLKEIWGLSAPHPSTLWGLSAPHPSTLFHNCRSATVDIARTTAHNVVSNIF